MRISNTTCQALLLIIAILSILSINAVPKAYAPSLGGGCECTLSPVPAYAQEGTVVSLVLSVKLSITGTVSLYQFVFNVKDPTGTTVHSAPMNHTTTPNEDQFTIIVAYPGPYITGSNSFKGQYAATVDETSPFPTLNVTNSTFILGITDSLSYERTQTVNVQASRYNASETVSVTIRTQTSSTTVFSKQVTASSTGLVTASWKILPNATIDNYVVTLAGTSTHKNPADTQTFSVRFAIISISGISSSQSTYRRTETMMFSFQPFYPDGSLPSTGVGLLSLVGPGGGTLTLTATYDSIAQTFDATYQTTTSNQTGTWTASLGGHGYSDAWGNSGPGTAISTSTQLTPATLSLTVDTNTNIAVGQSLNLNITVEYPDGTTPQTASVRAYLVYTGSPAINDTVPVVYDSTLGFWVGTYTAKPGDTGGLWSFIVTASDSASPPNTGQATRAITIQNGNNTVPTSPSFPLFYFGILAAIIAGILLAVLLVFKKRRVGHASLKIDLEAVHSEAGRIESQEFFQTIKEQVRKDLEDKK